MVEQSELETQWSMITDDSGVQRAAEALAAGHGPAGVDAERASGFTYGSEAYLVQVYRRGAGTFLFDPIGISNFAPLADSLHEVEWIFHAASQDIPCLDEIGLHPPQLFDTELAARLLGYERVGLGSVVEQLLGISLEKAHSAADWSQRPLPESWLEYAALDVALLPELRDLIHADLVANNKLEYAAQEFEAVRTKPEKPKSAEPWRKLSNGPTLRSARSLALVRELWTARDELARARDVAPGRLIPDKSVIAAAAANPRSKNDLARLQTFRGRASRTEIDRWWDAIRRGKVTEDLPGPKPRDPDSIPHHRGWAQRHPEAAMRLAAARTAVEAEAERQHMPAENLITPDFVRRLAWSPPEDLSVESVAQTLVSFGARDWQAALTAPILAPVFVENIQTDSN